MPTIKIKPLPKKSSNTTPSCSRAPSTQSIDLTFSGSEPSEAPILGPDSSGTPQNDKADAVTDVVQYHNGRLCHFFPTLHKCKTSLGGVHRYQDTKDKSSTTNLKHHAIECFGEDAVNTALKGKDTGPNNQRPACMVTRQPSHIPHAAPDGPRFPIWARYLTATSTAVERVFSQGCQLLHFARNRLSPSTIRAYLCLGAWGRYDLFFMEDLLAAVTSRKRKQSEVEDAEKIE
ncbi:hypothetical protein V8B97DRAFT_2011168 [Scleroderma yunnanense]